MIALSLVSGFTSAGVENTALVGGLVAGLLIGMVIYRSGTIEKGTGSPVPMS